MWQMEIFVFNGTINRKTHEIKPKNCEKRKITLEVKVKNDNNVCRNGCIPV